MHSHIFDTSGEAVDAIGEGLVPDGDVILLPGLTAVVCGIGDGYLWPITVMQSNGLRDGVPFTCLRHGEHWADALDGRYARSAEVALALGVARMTMAGSPEYRRCLKVAREQGWQDDV